MNADKFSVEMLLEMRHSPIKNYIVPGLTSYLIGGTPESGRVRLFDCERDHQESIVPHSHRFDFQCWVLRGHVVNRVWTENRNPYDDKGDRFFMSTLTYSGEQGKYEQKRNESSSRWMFKDDQYYEGECYRMSHHEIHSIRFSRDALVLFFEGPNVTDESNIIEPCVDYKVVPVFKTEDWMFLKETS